ncbi:MAG: DUF1963 domain-containing protein [Solirubrobacterales bacterium]|nr:DUF1963 domain-containing protein [Solirubrobacterales bacterium]
MRASEVEALASEFGLDDVGAELARLVMPCVSLRYPDAPGSAPGRSKFGGLPDLPDDLEWPLRVPGQPAEGDAMRFIAQIRLADIAEVLPWPHGVAGDSMLWFFCANDGGIVDEPDSGIVMLFGVGDELAPRDPPASGGQPATLEEVAVSPSGALTLPAPGSLALALLGLDGYEGARVESYWELRTQFTERQGLVPPAHQLLGHPDSIQGDVLDQAAFFADRARGGDGSGSEAQAPNWRLLLQVEGDERLGELWGDGGMLYFCIPGSDLESARYDRVQALTQSG